MSWQDAPQAICPDNIHSDVIEQVIIPRARDLGGFEVRRVLPAPKRRLVGPFIFFDQAGPAQFTPGKGIDVRPHPHIGLATVTYLFEGEFLHRDSLGTEQMIYPGEVNWMIAGKGVTHSERTSEETRQNAHHLYGIQTWVALPKEFEDVEPSFEHHGKEALPFIEKEGAAVTLIIGDAYGKRAPIKTFSKMFYCHARLLPGAILPLPDNHVERGVYIIEGAIELAGEQFAAGQMLAFHPGREIAVKAADSGVRLMLLGGEPIDGKRYIDWNFVSSSQEKIDAAKAAWRAEDWINGPFRLPPGDEQEFIPLPGE